MSAAQRIAPERLHRFLRPRSIALVGATDNSRWSLSTFENLKRFGFSGPIALVNPNRGIVHGEKAFRSLRELPEPVDLAFIMVSTARVLSVVKEAAEIGIKQFVVLTSGFSELGVEGAQLEHNLLLFAQEHELLILGPNGNGFINVTDRITPYGLPLAPPLMPGSVGVVLQSGALASAVMSFAQAHAIGLSLLISMGNECMLSVIDVVDYLLDDDATRSIALFLESIRQPEELRWIAHKARERRKPIVVMKIGRSETSARSALAHTGALVGNDAVNDAAFRQLGIIRVHSLEDLLITAGLISAVGDLSGRRMAVVTPSGGACDIISDLAQDEGIVLPEFASETIEKLQTVLPPFSTAHNPLDVTGYVVVDVTLQRRALDVVINDPQCDFTLYLATIDGALPPTPAQLETTLTQYDLLTKTIRAAPHPVVLISNTCLDLTSMSRLIIERTGLHFIAGMEHGVHSIARLLWWSEQMRTPVENIVEEALLSPPSLAFPRVGNWSEVQTRTLLQEANIPVTPGILATSAEEAVQAALIFGLPVALKVQSTAIIHKSDVGGVALHLDSEAAVQQKFRAMKKHVQFIRPDASIEGLLVSPMRSAGIELLVGILRDPLWGLVLTLGLGGIWAEALKDTTVRVLPTSQKDIETMLGELRGIILLRGGRGQVPADLHVVSDVIYRITVLAQTLGPQLTALEINPLWVQGSHVEALDALLTW